MLEISCAPKPLQNQLCPNSTVHSETPQVPKHQNYTKILFFPPCLQAEVHTFNQENPWPWFYSETSSDTAGVKEMH